MEIPYQERSFSSFFAFGYRVHTKWRNKFKLERVRWKINNEEFDFKKLGNEFIEEICKGNVKLIGIRRGFSILNH
jgi:hypothetical protein